MKTEEEPHAVNLLAERTDQVRLFAMRGTLLALSASPLAGRMKAVESMRKQARRQRRKGNKIESITLFATAKHAVRLKA